MARKKRPSSSGITLIKKANNLIESRYKFDIWETRVFLSVLSQIRREDDEFHIYRIRYKDVIKNFELSSGDSYEYLRKAAKGLMRQQFFVTYDKEGVGREIAYQIIITADYMAGDGNKKGGKRTESQEYIDVQVHPEMKPFLLQLQKNFTAYDLKNVVKLGVYPIRVYELMKQYETIGWRTLDIDELKRMFELTKEYKRFNDFYRFVIQPAVRDINKHTDLKINDVQKIKEGRRVVALKFIIEGKRSPKNPSQKTLFPKIAAEGPFLIPDNSAEIVSEPEESKFSMTESDRLFSLFQEIVVQKYGVTPSVFLGVLKNSTEEQVRQAIRVTQRAKANAQIKSSVAGFFIKALKTGFTDEKEEASKRKRKAEQEKKNLIRLQQLKDKKEADINDTIRSLISKEPTLTESAIAGLKNNPLSGIYIEKKESDLKRSLVVEDFREDETLRRMVKQQIMSLKPKAFEVIAKKFDKAIAELKRG